MGSQVQWELLCLSVFCFSLFHNTQKLLQKASFLHASYLSNVFFVCIFNITASILILNLTFLSLLSFGKDPKKRNTSLGSS